MTYQRIASEMVKMIQPADGGQPSPRTTSLTRRTGVRFAIGAIVALATTQAAPASEAARKKRKKQNKKKDKQQSTEWWKGTWTTYHGTAMIPAGTLTLQQSGNKITGTLVDPDNVSLPINAGTAGDRGREILGLMYNAHFAINIELKLVGDHSFSGYYWISGSPAVPWTGFKQ